MHGSRLQLPQLLFSGKYEVMSQVFRRGRPSGCIILELLGAYPPHLSLFAHESELVASFCIIYMVGTLTATKVISPCEPSATAP